MKDVLGFVSLVLVLPFVVPAGLMVLAGLYIAQLLIKIAGTGSESDKSAEGQRLENDKWSGVSESDNRIDTYTQSILGETRLF